MNFPMGAVITSIDPPLFVKRMYSERVEFCFCRSGDCIQISAALATGLSAKIIDELSGTLLLQLEGSQDFFNFRANADPDLAESR